MKHKLLILITGVLILLLVGFTQNQNEKTLLRSSQQSMLISIESMNNVLAYDITNHTVSSEKAEFSHTCYYIYDHFEANIEKLVVGVLLNESNMTNFASTDNAKYLRSNG
ncbi:MAG: hypothetical protein C0592_07495 [Marinilabiliales bacterium]|nr:MAG: hypothetical protein C0592_07495 [Marinilabiliales bacterium]